MYYRPHISVGHLLKEPLEVLRELFGGTILRGKDKLGFHWVWRMSSTAQTFACAEELLPYLVVKRKQAELLIQFRGVSALRGQHPKTGQFMSQMDGYHAIRAQYHALMMSLNKRRVHAERASEEAPGDTGQDGAVLRTHGNENRESLQETDDRLVQ